MKKILAGIMLLGCFHVQGQDMNRLADSIRISARIPELGYAVISSDSTLDMGVSGWKKWGTQRAASLNDRFRIGSNTKAITGFIAAELIKEGKLRWDSKFFELFPELRSTSRPEYRNLTLLQLLSFRTRLPPYTYTNTVPEKRQFVGNDSMQRYEFAQWFFRQPPVKGKDSISFSNLGFVAAGLMLEKASGHPYQQLVEDLGRSIKADFGFGQPNQYDTLQVWGHDEHLKPVPPADDYKLEWLQAAGNINASLPGYIRFIQLQLSGLEGKSARLSKGEFNFLHFGLKTFAVGWFWDRDENGQQYAYNTGNPGSFLSKVYVYPGADRAFIIFANVQSEEAEEGMNAFLEGMKRKYRH